MATISPYPNTIFGSQIEFEFGNKLLRYFLFVILHLIYIGSAEAGKPGGTTSATYVPMSMQYENYDFRNLSGDNSCLGEDDEFHWKAVGSLKPGESYTFTPQYPACDGHPAEISVTASWQGSKLELSSNAPDYDFASWDPSQKDKKIVAPVVNNSAQLCMFPYYRSNGMNYTITVTNVGDTTASNVSIDGQSNNDWAVNFYNRCLNADADHDGWNDSLEHSIANLVYPIGYLDGVYQPYILWGANYLKSVDDTTNPDDEVDSSPADFTDDGMVDNRDVDKIRLYLGEGNGIPLESISPNPSDKEFIWNNTKEWRRFDLDADGYVGQSDIDIVQGLVGQSMPMLADTIAPFARLIPPALGTVSKGQYYRIIGHVWDNSAVSKVDYLVDGKAVCSFSAISYACWWNVPKRQASYQLQIRIQDAAGNSAVSKLLALTAI